MTTKNQQQICVLGFFDAYAIRVQPNVLISATYNHILNKNTLRCS